MATKRKITKKTIASRAKRAAQYVPNEDLSPPATHDAWARCQTNPVLVQAHASYARLAHATGVGSPKYREYRSKLEACARELSRRLPEGWAESPCCHVRLVRGEWPPGALQPTTYPAPRCASCGREVLP
jgi:hypothetical protein